MPKKPKTKYTLRADGRICLSKVIDGHRRFFYGADDNEVERKLADFLAAKQAAVDASHTVGRYLNDWWEARADKFSPNSVLNYRKAKERCYDEFGSRAVSDVTPQEVYLFLSKFAAQGYSQRVMGLSKTVLTQAFDLAFLAGEIDRNICRGLPPVKCKPMGKREAAADSDIALLEQHKNDSLMAKMHYFMLYTGCRRGEAVGLRQSDIDRKRKVAHISRSIAYGGVKPTVKAPKSASGIRDVQLLDNVLEILPTYKDPDTYIFFPDGLPTMKKLEYGMSQFQKKIGLSCTAHQLRHSYASMLHSAGVAPKDAQALLGHSSIDMTMDIYTHLEQQHKDALRNDLNAFVSNRLTTFDNTSDNT